MSGDNVLSRDDLFLLMEAYRNNIELSTTLLQQQNQIIEQLQKTTNHQEKICASIDGVASKLDTSAEQMQKTYQEIIIEKTKCQAQVSKEHSTIMQRVNLVYVGLGTLVIPLVAFLVEAFHKLEIINKIATHLGVG